MSSFLDMKIDIITTMNGEVDIEDQVMIHSTIYTSDTGVVSAVLRTSLRL